MVTTLPFMAAPEVVNITTPAAASDDKLSAWQPFQVSDYAPQHSCRV